MTHSVDGILAALLPAADETALLEACLHRGVRAREAWARWRAGRPSQVETLRRDLSAARTLMPLLAQSVAASELDLEPDLLSYVRAAALREELRAKRFRQLASAVLALLDRNDAPIFVARGAALAATVYDAWSHRHCHDLDLLVEPDWAAHAARALEDAGFASAARSTRAPDSLVVEHTSGLQVALHTRPFALRYYDAAVRSFVEPSAISAVNGTRMRLPSPEATLVHVLGHATYSPSRRNLRWVTDVWHLVQRVHPLGWPSVVDRLKATRLALAVAPLLAYVARLGVSIPPWVLAEVKACAATTGRTPEDVALGGALAAQSGDAGVLWRATESWHARLRVTRWALVPSPDYLRHAFDLPTDALLPLCYVYRPVRFVAGRLVTRLAGRSRGTRPAATDAGRSAIGP